MSMEDSELSLDDSGDPFGLGGAGHDHVEEVSDEEALHSILEMAPDDLGALLSIGHIYRQRGEYDKAEHSFRQILSLSGGNYAAKANAYCNLGVISLKRGNPDKALENYEEACQCYRQRDNLEGLALVLCNMGKIYRKQNDLEHAEAYFKKSLELNEKLGRKQGMIADYTSLGLICYSCDDLAGAEAYYRKALALEEEQESKNGMAVMYGNIGAIARKRGDLETAREYWTIAVDLFREIGARQMIVKVQRWLDFLPR